MRTKPVILFLFLLLVGAGIFVWHRWKQAEPRRTAVASLLQLQHSLDAAGAAAVLDTLVLPSALRSRTAAEQAEFVRKTLRDEVSPEGVTALKKEGRFGPLRDLFPGEADQWARLAGTNPENCVAFRMERHGIRAEVVLLQSGDSYKIIRCNNVKQMAGQ